MLSSAQAAHFTQRGWLRLPHAIEAQAAAGISQRIWSALEASTAIRQSDPASWRTARPFGFQRISRSGAFAALDNPDLRGALDHLLGVGQWERPKHWGMPLVTFPDPAATWQVPYAHWHLDFAARGPAHPLPGLRVLAFAAQAPPQGGGTLIVQGAHALVEQLVASGRARDGHSRQVRAVLARASDWFKTLMSNTPAPDRINRFMIEGATVDGVRLRVIQLTGQPGDVVLMHPWALHAAAPNCAHYPRMMLGQSILRTP